jgi:hypothetical protein
MKKLTLLFSLAIGALVSQAQPIKTPQPSSTQKITQEFGIGSMELSYSRPSLKGRKAFGTVVPFNKVWRTGANSPTRIKFSDSVTINGKGLAAGEYSIFSVPTAKSWAIHFNKDSKLAGAAGYNAAEDVLVTTVSTAAMGSSMETLTMQFANITNNTCELHIMWENTAVKIPISTDVDAKVMKQISDAMTKDNHPYYAAANYYMENGKDLNQAVEWFNKATDLNPKAFWIWLGKARCYKKLGKNAEALEASKKSMELAKAADNQDYVRMNTELQAELKQ